MEKSRTVYAKGPEVKAAAELVIKDFLEVMKTSKVGKDYTSDTFMVGETPMAIRVYPNGEKEEYKGNVSVYLRNLSDAALTIKCQFITEAVTWSFDHEVNAKNGWGLAKFLSHAKCTVYKEKDFILTAHVEMPGKDLKILGTEDTVVPKKYCVCKNLYDKMMEPNFALVFKGAEVGCHKQVLAAASPVFEAMVENQHLEAIESKANIELSEEVGRAFVKFIYTGELEEGFLKEQALAFLELGNKYDVQGLKNLAEGELLRQLNRKNMVELVSIGDIFNATKIFEAALKMTKANMSWLRSQVKAELCLRRVIKKNQSLAWPNIQEGGMEDLKKLSQDVMVKLL